jgi:hypothetical protein
VREDYTHKSSTFLEDPEVDLGNKLTFFSHWINPEVKFQMHEEPILLCKAKTVAKSGTKEVEKSRTLTKDQEGGDKLEKKVKKPESYSPCTEKKA